MSAQNKKIQVKNLPIRLGQFLKLANVVQDGFEAKMRIQNGEVMVNSIVEIRRGRQLKNLDKITVGRASWIVDIVE